MVIKFYFAVMAAVLADSQHLAAEFVGRFQKERRGLPAIALTVDTSILTAVSNDYGYDKSICSSGRGFGASRRCFVWNNY